MGHDKGKPSAPDKSEGIVEPEGGKFLENLERDQDLTEKYTDGNQNIADHLRQNNPNRNVDKEDATNAGGYRN